MSTSVLAFIVIGQIAVFQFAAVAFTRSVFAATLGPIAEPTAAKCAAYLRRAGQRRFGLGGVLFALAVAGLLGIPADAGGRKILLAVASLTSAGALGGALFSDRRALRALREALPEGGVRRASLEPRTVSRWYRPIWELVPVAILVATVVLAASLGQRAGHIPARMWVLQILQAVVVVGGLVYTYRRGAAVPNVSARLATLRDRPELALKFGEQLAIREMQYWMGAKIGVALLLGVITVSVALETLEHSAAHVLNATEWVIVGLLLVLFLAYTLTIVTLTRRTNAAQPKEGNDETVPEMEPPSDGPS